MTIERYRIQRNSSTSPLARYIGNSAIDNLIQAHQEQGLFLEEVTQEIEKAIFEALKV